MTMENSMTLPQALERIKELEAQVFRLNMDAPMEEDLCNRIDEMCKRLLVDPPVEPIAVGKLLVDCQKRMAADWVSVGNAEREANRLQKRLNDVLWTMSHKPISDDDFSDVVKGLSKLGNI